MRKNFKDLAIGEKFHCGQGPVMIFYKKTTKSKAVVTLQVGFGNSRLVGSVFHIAPLSSVWN